MGLWTVLDELWHTWSEPVPSALLLVLLVILTVGWIAAGVVIQLTARHRLANAYGWTVATLVLAVAIAAAGISTPNSFDYWLIAGLALTPLAALANRSLIERAAASCAEGHPLAASWVYCPVCPAPPREAGRRQALVGATVSPSGPHTPALPPEGAYRARQGMANPTVDGFDSAAAPRPTGATGDVLLWLVPDTRPELGERVVRKPGATIGRNPSSDVIVDDAGASWDHARIVERTGSPSIIDLVSSNGTYVNNERVETSLLISGDRLKVGDTVFRVVRP